MGRLSPPESLFNFLDLHNRALENWFNIIACKSNICVSSGSVLIGTFPFINEYISSFIESIVIFFWGVVFF